MVLLEDIFDKAIENTRAIIEEKNPNLENKDEVATAVGVGAIIFNDLSNNRIKDVDFNWEEALSFEGNTGPYVQYTHARCAGILDKANREINLADIKLTDDYEKALVKVLDVFPEKITQARDDLEPICYQQISSRRVPVLQPFLSELPRSQGGGRYDGQHKACARKCHTQCPQQGLASYRSQDAEQHLRLNCKYKM